MLHMKSISAVSIATFTAGASVFLPPLANPVMAAPFKPNIPADQRGILGIDMTTDISAVRLAGICFLPDCPESGLLDGNYDMDINSDSKFCEDRGYVSSCPENTSKIPDSECYRDASYFKCSEAQWCKDNGYNTTSCSVPQYPSEQCPNGELLYKSCKTDSAQACKELGYTNSCPSGQKLKKNSGRCTYDSSYGTCCTPSGCPSYTSLTSSSYGTNGTDGCEYACYYTCDPNCPDGTSTSNPGGCGGSTQNGCGNVTCYYPYQSCCSYTTTEAYCSAQCKYTSGSSCVKNGATYYSSCGSSKCGTGYSCSNGTCVSTCNYSYTSASCAAQCKNVGSMSCVKDGTTYYESCGSSKCGTGYTCSNGTCTSTCNYTITKESCEAQCKNVGSMSCVKDGTTYYESCGSSKCGTGYTCSNGTCTSTCNYTITKESCEAQCKSVVGAISCVKDGTTYYETCGISLCSSGQTCENGICVSPAPASGDCCGYSSCGYYNGTSHSNDSGCQSEFGMSCYNYCMERFGVACSDMQTSCTASGGSLVFQSCYVAGFNGYFSAKFTCE